MPYKSNKDLPSSQTKQYGENQRSAFRHAFNSQLERGRSEKVAYATAHSAAKRARRAKAKRRKK